jgi:hypothetical protein
LRKTLFIKLNFKMLSENIVKEFAIII